METIKIEKVLAFAEVPFITSRVDSEKYDIRVDDFIVGGNIYAIYNSRYYNEDKPSIIITSFSDDNYNDVYADKYGFSADDVETIKALKIGEIAKSEDYGFDACVVRIC